MFSIRMLVLSLLPLLFSSPSPAATCPAPEPDRVVHAPTLDAEEVARALAPVIFVEGARIEGRRHWDLPMAVDFDGDRIAENNADALLSGDWRDRIEPVLYWSVLETETHVFATYHAFHGLDWAWWPNLALYEWHENDGENLQVVARKTDRGLVVELVATQAHLATHVAPVGDAAWASREVDLEEPAWTVGGRVAVYMERGGHGLYPAAKKGDRFEGAGSEIALRRGIRLDPAAEGASVAPPRADDREGAYRLVSTEETFWAPFLAGTQHGDGRLTDKEFAYCDALVGPLRLPRHYDSDMISGPGKRDSGISPFAVGTSLTGGRLGALFFDPARRWAEVLDAPADWSDRYVGHPYVASLGESAQPPGSERAVAATGSPLSSPPVVYGAALQSLP